MAAWKRMSRTILYLVLVLPHIFSRLGLALTIRGVAVTKLPFYDSSKDFTCLDGSLTIPFTSINDDYCDCKDGSDEPGTSACPNGKFHCTNAGFKPKNYPSSRVNDGICDCCDGSDEYDGIATCPNHCKELYKHEYEKRKQEIELAKEGFVKKQEFSLHGKDKKEERKKKMEELKTQLEEKIKVVEDLRVKKEHVETVEKEATDKHDKEWEETKTKLLAEREQEAAVAAFAALDADSSGSLTVQEVIKNQFLDKEHTEEEARELLGGSDQVDVGRFSLELWSNIKDKYRPKEEPAKQEQKPTDATPTEVPPVPPPPPPAIDDTIEDDADMRDVGDDEDDEDEDKEGDEMKDEAVERARPAVKHDKDVELKKPEYDEETKAKISEADNARKEFDSADSAKTDIEREISDIEKMLKIDFGEHEEFAAMYGQCFELRDREYLYKLCPFEKASQEPKDGGSDTSIGIWGEWTGHPNKFSRMKYTGGQNCWNGPDRSTEVLLSCGNDNEVVSVSEPSRCEYQMVFKTPAVCEDGSTMIHDHQEL